MLNRLVTILILLAAVGFASADLVDTNTVTIVGSGESKLPATSDKNIHYAKIQRILQENELLKVQIKNAELKRELKREVVDPPSETQNAKIQRILYENELLRAQIKNAELKRNLKEIVDPHSETQDDED